MPEAKHCPTCGQKLREYDHRLTPMLADILVNLAKTVRHHDRNDIHVPTEVPAVVGPLRYSMQSNLTKLRFHALVAKVLDDAGHHIRGRWLITRRGGQWLRGEITIPRTVTTRDNRVIGHSADDQVDISAVRKSGPYLEGYEDVVSRPVPVEEYVGTAVRVAIKEKPKFGQAYCERHFKNYTPGGRCPGCIAGVK